MALKAGLVGVNPKGVDKNGMPIASGGSGVDEAQLTANGKKFFFAYDETSEKYGYKLDGAGDFIPFESAGGGPGWVKPAELSSSGIASSTTYREIVEGGQVKIDGINYVDIILHQTATASGNITGFKKPVSGFPILALYGSTLDAVKDVYGPSANAQYAGSTYSISGVDGIISIGSQVTGDAYVHLFFEYATND